MWQGIRGESERPVSMLERGRSFGAIAEDYDRYRPGPPTEAVAWVLGTDRSTALDLGAGTGGLTSELSTFVPRLLALEPDARMRRVLARRIRGAAILGATGEQLPVADHSLDAVLASSSWHWMDPAAAGAEVARVLRPGGVFGLLWSGPDRSVPWVAHVLGTRGPRLWRDPMDVGRRRIALDPGLPFGAPESALVRFTRPMDEDDLAGLSGTYSRVVVKGGTARAARIEAVRSRARRSIGPEPAELPMTCRCWRVIRLGD